MCGQSCRCRSELGFLLRSTGEDFDQAAQRGKTILRYKNGNVDPDNSENDNPTVYEAN